MNIITQVISLFVLLFALTVHEAAHAWAASRLGDMTARSLGRVSLNPLVHIDPIGTVLLPLILFITQSQVFFGWAKPVPYNPFLLKNPKRDSFLISAAGPIANLLTAASSLLVILIIKMASPPTALFLSNFLRGQHALPRGFYPLEGLSIVMFFAVIINTILAVFNLIPIPPLDGSGVLMGLLPDAAAQKFDRIRPYGFLILLGLIYLRALDLIIRPIWIFIYTIIR